MCSNGPIKIKLGLVLGLSVTFASMAHANFSDIAGHTHAEAVLYVQSQGIVQGYADGSFKPNATINRAEFTKIIVESQFTDSTIANCTLGTSMSLSDVPTTEWFAKYVCTAQKNGLISGYPDKTFRPANTINYVEAAKILVGAFQVSSVPMPGEWYEQYTSAIQSAGVAIQPPLAPDTLLTRGQMAQLIYNFSMLPENIHDTLVPSVGMYTDYNASLVGVGAPVLLFFHASWCPHCKAHDAFLAGLYAVGNKNIRILKIDYDASADLKSMYGVVTQDTFVHLDGNGLVIEKFSFPSNAKLEEVLSSS